MPNFMLSLMVCGDVSVFFSSYIACMNITDKKRNQFTFRTGPKNNLYGILDDLKPESVFRCKDWPWGRFAFFRPEDTVPANFVEKIKTIPESVKKIHGEKDLTFSASVCIYEDGVISSDFWKYYESDANWKEWEIAEAPQTS